MQKIALRHIEKSAQTLLRLNDKKSYVRARTIHATVLFNLGQYREAAEIYGVDVRAVQADMRDLSALADAGFDLVYQPYSLTFVPDASPTPPISNLSPARRA